MNDIVAKVESWVERGIISFRTAKRILAAEGVDAEQALQVRSGGRLVGVISVLGSILVGLGVILFFAKNWEMMAIATKLFLIFAGVIAAYGSGYYLQYVKGSYPRVGYALILLGGIFYGAGLFLVSQFFHTDANPRWLFFIWGAGLMPLAAIFAHEALFVLSVGVFLLWSLFTSFSGLFSGNVTPEYWYALLTAAVFLPIAWRFRFTKGFALLVALFYIWYGVAAVAWQVNVPGAGEGVLPRMLLYVLGLGLALILGGRLLEFREDARDFAYVMRFLGGAGVGIPVYILSWNEALYMRSDTGLPGLALAVFFGVFALVAVLLALYGMRTNGTDRKQLAWRESAVLAFIGALALAFYLIPVDGGSQYYYDAVMPSFHPFVLPWNAALLAFNVLLITVGYFEKRNIFINLGIVLFLIHVISRYFDVFALRFGTSFSFIAGGVLLIVLALALERFRRNLIAHMKASQETIV